MANKHKDISDAQVLGQLRTRKLRLQLELERVIIAIKAFENIQDIDPLDAALYSDEIVIDTAPLQDDIARSILMYNPKMTAEKKIEFTLRNIESGDTHDITEYILRVDGHIKDVTRLFNNITFVCSRMLNSGRLLAEKHGKRNVFRLK